MTALLALTSGGGEGLRAWAAQGVAYEVTLEGLPDPAPDLADSDSATGEGQDLARLLRASSTLFQLQSDPPPTAAGLQRRASADQERLIKALRSMGYYRGRVQIVLTDPARVRIAVTPGPRYRFGSVAVAGVAGAALPAGLNDGRALGLVPGVVVEAARVPAAETRLKERLGESAHALARITERHCFVDHQRQTLDVTFTIAPGPRVHLGAARIEHETRDGAQAADNGDVDPQLVRDRLAWTPGTAYHPRLLDQTRQKLLALGVFAGVTLELAAAPDPDGTWPVVIRLTPRPRHFLGVSANFSTGDGFGGKAWWGHRNLWGGGEQLRFSAEADRVNGRTLTRPGQGHNDIRFGADLKSPDVLAPEQTGLLALAALSEHPPAYDRAAITAATRLERPLADHLTGSGGVAGERGRVTAGGRREEVAMMGMPFTLAWDDTDNALDPRRGARLGLETTPWSRLDDSAGTFLVARVSHSAYLDLNEDGALVVAGRFVLGSVVGGSGAGLPADKRFHSGGSMLRGYGYQKVGPRDASGDPLGGRSLVEAGAELRIRLNEELGLVPFLDAGNVFAEMLPQPGETLRLGTGLGLRYYTALGPLRLDVGVPLDRRRDDDPWQLHLSLGQAF